MGQRSSFVLGIKRKTVQHGCLRSQTSPGFSTLKEAVNRGLNMLFPEGLELDGALFASSAGAFEPRHPWATTVDGPSLSHRMP